MAKIDLKVELKQLYHPSSNEISVVDVPTMTYLMVDGRGNPNTSSDYAAAVEALYAVAYALKFAIKKGAGGADYTVMPLEGLWWAENMDLFSVQDKDSWQWTMMIAQPQQVTPALFAETITEVKKKKDLSALANMRLEAYHEGPSAQILYLGSYADEGPTVARLHAFIQERGHRRQGKHHEIYLGDPRRTAPEKLRTVIRQPFQ